MKQDPNPHKTSAESASLLSYRGGGGGQIKASCSDHLLLFTYWSAHCTQILGFEPNYEQFTYRTVYIEHNIVL